MKTQTKNAFIAVLLTAIGLMAWQMYRAEKHRQGLESRQSETTQAMRLLSLRYQSLDSLNANNERRIEAMKYTYCTLLQGKYQFTPAITASWQQFNGLTDYVMNYYPKNLTRCACDSILNSHNRISDLNAELLIQNNPYGYSN